MEKFLFTDGTSGVKEVHSRQELEELAETTTSKHLVQVWVYSQSEWLSWAVFSDRFPYTRRQKTATAKADKSPLPETALPVISRTRSRRGWKILGYGLAAAALFLVFNFTRLNWEKTSAITLSAVRPDNVPYIDVDSLVTTIEQTRGQRIDRNTKSNLRLRNTWPDHILAEVAAERMVNSGTTKYSKLKIKIDNATGHTIDEATVLLTVWKDREVSTVDTIHFSDVTFNGSVYRELPGVMRGDSLSVAFVSITAKTFNFCYSAATENNSGNYNDRWFCRGK